MKWKEMSALHKVVSVIGVLCGVVYFALSILEFTQVLSDTHTVAQILPNILFLSYGILSLKRHRNMAIFWLVLGGIGILVSVIYLFV